MKSYSQWLLIALVLITMAAAANAQADDFCREFGESPAREIDRDNRLAPYVFGRVVLKGFDPTAKPPKVTAIFSDSAEQATRQQIGKSGNFCFRRRGSGGTIVIDLDGVEVARRTVSDIGNTRQREDFEVTPQTASQTAPPGVVSAKFSRDPNERTIELYKKAADAERAKRLDEATELVRQIVAIDPADFIAWAKLGSLFVERAMLPEAENAFRKALTVQSDYTPVIINLGLLKALQGQYPEAIRYFERAVASDPTSPRAYRMLGEAYLQVRRGGDGLAALDEALRLDPVGMAECHLLKARLYDLAGAKDLAAAEYKAFLTKVPDHPDKKKFEKYVKENQQKPSE